MGQSRGVLFPSSFTTPQPQRRLSSCPGPFFDVIYAHFQFVISISIITKVLHYCIPINTISIQMFVNSVPGCVPFKPFHLYFPPKVWPESQPYPIHVSTVSTPTTLWSNIVRYPLKYRKNVPCPQTLFPHCFCLMRWFCIAIFGRFFNDVTLVEPPPGEGTAPEGPRANPLTPSVKTSPPSVLRTNLPPQDCFR